MDEKLESLNVNDKPRVLIGVPAYRGTSYITATLHSIQAQQFAAFHVLISIDNSDQETALVCQPFLVDRRFRLVVQDRHLNWDGNINWLMSQDGYEFFCYWQQDDLATADYLQSLVRFADDNRNFVCAFSDIEWMDGKQRWTCPTIAGFPLSRALYVIEKLNAAPFRGLIRKDAIERAGPIRRTEFESAWEDLVWLARLAREGNMGRVEGPLYFKRRHRASVSFPWMGREKSWKRAVWLEVGLGMLETVLPTISPSEYETALAVVLQRLCWPLEGRFRLYDPSSDRGFASEFLQAARERYRILSPQQEAKDGDIVRQIFQFLRNQDVKTEQFVTRLKAQLRDEGSAELHFGAHQDAGCLRKFGWSEPEEWGAWSVGPLAELRLPIPRGERGWRIRLRCRSFASGTYPQTILVDCNGTEYAWRFESLEVHEEECHLAPQEGLEVLSFRFPDAVSPQALGMSSDNRDLGLGLLSVTIVGLG